MNYPVNPSERLYGSREQSDRERTILTCISVETGKHSSSHNERAPMRRKTTEDRKRTNTRAPLAPSPAPQTNKQTKQKRSQTQLKVIPSTKILFRSVNN